LEKNLSVPESDDEQQTITGAQEKTVCDSCGEEYEHPLQAELISGDHSEEYSACPRCLTKAEVKHQEKIATTEDDEEKEEQEELEIKQEISKTKVQGPEDCPQYLGYLGKRPKNSPIPDSCFVCTKMIDCTL